MLWEHTAQWGRGRFLVTSLSFAESQPWGAVWFGRMRMEKFSHFHLYTAAVMLKRGHCRTGLVCLLVRLASLFEGDGNGEIPRQPMPAQCYSKSISAAHRWIRCSQDWRDSAAGHTPDTCSVPASSPERGGAEWVVVVTMTGVLPNTLIHGGELLHVLRPAGLKQPVTSPRRQAKTCCAAPTRPALGRRLGRETDA